MRGGKGTSVVNLVRGEEKDGAGKRGGCIRECSKGCEGAESGGGKRRMRFNSVVTGEPRKVFLAG